MTNAIRIMVIDDHPVICRGVELLVEEAPDVSVVGQAASGIEAIDVLQHTRPDLALLDLRLPDRSGLDVARQMDSLFPEIQVILFTAYQERNLFQGSLPANIRGCILKDISAIELVSFIRAAAAGRDVADPRLADKPLPRRRAGHDTLTAREHDVLRAAAAGDTNTEIAEALGLMPNTIKSYFRTIMQKLDARNRLEAVMIAQQQGLL